MDDLAIAIWRCCRDWPVVMPTVLGMGKCGLCGEVPEPTDKTLAEYMAERRLTN